MGRSDNEIARGKGVKRAQKHGCRQVWAVAVERDNARALSGRKVCEHRSESSRKSLPGLRNNAHRIAGHTRQIIDIRSGTYGGDLYIVERLGQRHSVVQKTTVQADNGKCGKILGQTGLHCSRPWRFRHDDEYAI